ncbi:NAD(P)/FAD-dependent oxidoreductase [Thermosediminibacter oceani]|uniref:HI0933 family protein n=1 Tax=Thermosediminibacter oceani (strain ATCC BAA-1034 / DSM 16646 / JW/IW-1228P) TaxID=555079 RepID=D9S3D7_THEOJ|nr:NAD(P)/FAD-dependent oxidoreductase [Thermosediminibacter oceani]ADL07914.1 HI0933 family protein [Thermosediminibacter oceani DSM 16646]
MPNRVAIVGGGAAGLMAAYQASFHGADVTLFERNQNLGRKILISGKGRCNLTNAKDLDEFIQNIPGNGKFLYSALTRFSNRDLISFFYGLGVKTKVERGGRVFPESDKASDVVRAFENALVETGVKIRYGMRVKEVIAEKGAVKGLIFYDSEEFFPCDRVIVATGGLSYPSTGSTGDGYNIARKLGHTVVEPRPSLVPLITKEDWVKNLQGLTLKNVEVTAYCQGRKLYCEFGEMLFTHYGVSGPIILTISRSVVDHIEKGVILSINLKPALDRERLENRLKRDFQKYSRKHIKNALDDLLPKRLIPVFIDVCRLDPEKPVNQLTREERNIILEKLTDFRVTVIGCMEKEAIVTRGGVSVKEIDARTMESKIIKGLYFAGEVIDVDGFTGGYNLQAAFSTGYLAGVNAASNDRRG